MNFCKYKEDYELKKPLFQILHNLATGTLESITHCILYQQLTIQYLQISRGFKGLSIRSLRRIIQGYLSTKGVKV